MLSYCATSPRSSAPWARRRATVSSMSSTANMTRCRPSVLGGGFSGSPPAAAGVRYLVSSSLLWPSGVRIIAMSLRTPSSPTVRSAHRPATCHLPSSSMPSSVKNATAASRSSTTMATLSIRRMVMSPSINNTADGIRRLEAGGSRGPAGQDLVAAGVGAGGGEERLVVLLVADRDPGPLIAERPDADPVAGAVGGEVLGVLVQPQPDEVGFGGRHRPALGQQLVADPGPLLHRLIDPGQQLWLGGQRGDRRRLGDPIHGEGQHSLAGGPGDRLV